MPDVKSECPKCGSGPDAYKTFRLDGKDSHSCSKCGYKDYKSEASSQLTTPPSPEIVQSILHTRYTDKEIRALCAFLRIQVIWGLLYAVSKMVRRTVSYWGSSSWRFEFTHVGIATLVFVFVLVIVWWLLVNRKAIRIGAITIAILAILHLFGMCSMLPAAIREIGSWSVFGITLGAIMDAGLLITSYRLLRAQNQIKKD